MRAFLRRSLNNNKLQYRMSPARLSYSLITTLVNPPADNSGVKVNPLLNLWSPRWSFRRTRPRPHAEAGAASLPRKRQREVRSRTTMIWETMISMKILRKIFNHYPVQRPMKAAPITLASFNCPKSTHQTRRRKRKRTSLMKLVKERRIKR